MGAMQGVKTEGKLTGILLGICKMVVLCKHSVLNVLSAIVTPARADIATNSVIGLH